MAIHLGGFFLLFDKINFSTIKMVVEISLSYCFCGVITFKTIFHPGLASSNSRY